MKRDSRPSTLIVNADDFNLTEGVSRGILRAHDRGIVTSTTVLINLPMPDSILRELKRRKGLGVGLHLNVTLGRPLSRPRDIPSLVAPDGNFKKRSALDLAHVAPKELAAEYEAQIRRFGRVLGRLPTHLDTHHHLHEHPKVFAVIEALAFRYRIPVRQSAAVRPAARLRFQKKGLSFTDVLIEDLDPSKAWGRSSLAAALRKVGAGTFELMCHPAFCDRALLNLSSFNKTRENELRALTAPAVRAFVRRRGIRLAAFGEMKKGS
ncbi:MAG: ChbG/HpnK family deacetylase [Candidatus Omnitrophica bacterium]|nr:ChbG/HpnK family deacetylase [Candidatus Omnitrophota bacterium]